MRGCVVVHKLPCSHLPRSQFGAAVLDATGSGHYSECMQGICGDAGVSHREADMA